MATGGRQVIPKNIFSDAVAKKVIKGDFCLTEPGLAELKRRLDESKVSHPFAQQRVCIVGGSHSAFSVAWLLLNRLFEPEVAQADDKDKERAQAESSKSPKGGSGGGAKVVAKVLKRKPYAFSAGSIVMLHTTRRPLYLLRTSSKTTGSGARTRATQKLLLPPPPRT